YLYQLDSLIKADFYTGIHSMLIARKGSLVYETYYNGYSGEDLHPIYSVTKSFSSLLIGIALEEEKIDRIQIPLSSLLNGYESYFDQVKENIRLDHLLSMTSGYQWDEWIGTAFDPSNSFYHLDRARPQIDYVLSRPLESNPGEKFRYNTGASNLIAPIIENVTGQPVEDFMKHRVFDPLNIDLFTWENMFDEYPSTGGYRGGLNLKPRDMMKLGQLYLDKGLWNGTQIVSETWVSNSTKASIDVTANQSYAHHWWTRRLFEKDGKVLKEFDALGSGGQWVFVFPELELVIAFTSGNYIWQGAPASATYQQIEMIEEYILRAIE
ncbi:MAG: serine hydrolase, partial [Bacteroidota bacterium]